VVTVFVGFLLHMSSMNLGVPSETSTPAAECPWKLGAMIVVAAVVIAFGFWVPGPVLALVNQSAHIIGGAPL
jgi:hypothetical protein